MKIDCVLFDLDGVLVDACDWHYEALNCALKKIVGFEINRKDHVEKYNGLPTLTKLKMLNIDLSLAKQIEALKQEITLKIIFEQAQIMPEKQELHEYLKNNNIKIACVTNSIKKTATEMLKCTGQLQYMDLIVSNEDVINNKPSPDCYNYAMDQLKVNYNNCVCVEDSPKGYEAAINSNAKMVWRVDGCHEVTLKNFKNSSILIK